MHPDCCGHEEHDYTSDKLPAPVPTELRPPLSATITDQDSLDITAGTWQQCW